MWAGGVFKVKTKDGTLVVEVNEPGAEVYVDGERVTVTWGEGGKKAEVRVRPGTRKVEVKKAGFIARGEEVELEAGGRRVLMARLERPPAPPPPPPPPPWWEQLFDKKDLRAPLPGQAGKPWFVADGALGNATGGTILTRKAYANFTLTLEFQVTPDTAASVDVWSYPGDTPIWVFLENTRNAMGAITYDGRERGFSVRRLKPPAEVKPEGQWNALAMEVRDGNLSVTVNGRHLDTSQIGAHVAGRRGPSPPAERLKGHIGLTKRWGRGRILIRNLVIKEK
jgi:hypothetical protein